MSRAESSRPAAPLGDFTTLLLSVNPALVANVYPQVWTQYTVTISGLPAPTSGRTAFRYFVTGAGSLGSNSDYIGIDNVVYTP
ncbi:choice-of-anchor J domain-containing protein [Diaphorobacter nitroreducens]|uniref:choice-of-anchor J domain-containing protein n=1 Tax=Diaphorobacter nitroreducens TaxID=164759 RepID=UPI0035E40D98